MRQKVLCTKKNHMEDCANNSGNTWKFSISKLKQKLIYIFHFPQGSNKNKMT